VTPSPTAAAAQAPASLRLRLFALVYEGILLFAVVFVASWLFIGLARDAQQGPLHLVFQVYLLSVCGAYFMYCWVRSGQTLPMKTWRMKLVMASGEPISMRAAFVRYVAAVPSMLLGVGILWALFDRDRQFLQDRIAGTRIIRAPQAQGAGQEAEDARGPGT
jgi:uncharacterized RDD family membrane protein YckC